MGYILVHARMPHGDHIETRNFDRRFEHDQPLIVLAKQARWNECDTIVRLQYRWHEQEARHGVANLAPQLEPSKRRLGPRRIRLLATRERDRSCRNAQ